MPPGDTLHLRIRTNIAIEEPGARTRPVRRVELDLGNETRKALWQEVQLVSGSQNIPARDGDRRKLYAYRVVKAAGDHTRNPNIGAVLDKHGLILAGGLSRCAYSNSRHCYEPCSVRRA